METWTPIFAVREQFPNQLEDAIFGSGDRTWTCSLRINSPLRLPIPPLRIMLMVGNAGVEPATFCV